MHSISFMKRAWYEQKHVSMLRESQKKRGGDSPTRPAVLRTRGWAVSGGQERTGCSRRSLLPRTWCTRRCSAASSCRRRGRRYLRPHRPQAHSSGRGRCLRPSSVAMFCADFSWANASMPVNSTCAAASPTLGSLRPHQQGDIHPREMRSRSPVSRRTRRLRHRMQRSHWRPGLAAGQRSPPGRRT